MDARFCREAISLDFFECELDPVYLYSFLFHTPSQRKHDFAALDSRRFGHLSCPFEPVLDTVVPTLGINALGLGK